MGLVSGWEYRDGEGKSLRLVGEYYDPWRLVDRWGISREMAAADRYYPVGKGGEKMASVPSWLILILNFLMSDLFDQLVEWAKDIIGEEDVRRQEDKDARRSLAVVKLRADAAVNGFKVTRWQAGQAVEAAYAVLNPHKTRIIG